MSRNRTAPGRTANPPNSGLVIWCNAGLAPAARAKLEAGIASGGHTLVWAPAASASVLEAGAPDPTLARCDAAFGQPDPAICRASPRLRWVALTTAGYTRYDTEETLGVFRQRGVVFTNASPVFAEPCAQHALACMLGLARALPAAVAEQLGERRWTFFERRAESHLLNGQTVFILGYGAIGRRLSELLAPFRPRILATRRTTRSEPGVHLIAPEHITAALAETDHLVNLLPENEHTLGFVNARRLSALKPGACFYNLGRGATVDERALLEALHSGRLRGAWLDVFAEEPLPPSHPFWTAPNCWITPHSAGGRADQDDALADLFLRNLARFSAGDFDGMEGRVA